MQNIQWVPCRDRPLLGARDIHVWRVNLADKLTDSMVDVLSGEEHERLRSFKRDNFRQRYGLARVALRHVLAQYWQVEAKDLIFRTLDQGKPYIDGSTLPFNISHAGDRALIAIAGSELSHVGVDVQMKDRRIDPLLLARRFFTKEESECIAQAPKERQAEVFVRFWVLKEAFVKAVGVGLSGGLDTFCVQLVSGDDSLLSCDARWGCVNRWQLKSLSVESGYYGALAVSDRSDFIKYFDYSNAGVGG